MKKVFLIIFLVTVFFVPATLNKLTAKQYTDINGQSMIALDPNITKETLDNSILDLYTVSKFVVADNVTNRATKSNSSALGQIKGITAEYNEDGTKLIFDVTKEFSTEVRILNFPFRLMFDIPLPYKWAVDNKDLQKENVVRVVNGFRYGYPENKIFRVIADLKVPVNINKAYISSVGNDYKLVIDLKTISTVSSILSSSTLVVASSDDYYSNYLQNEKNANNKAINDKRDLAIDKWVDSYLNKVSYPVPMASSDKSSRPVIVVVDPGHGGKDPGANISAGETTVKEKDIVLSTAKLLQSELEKNPEIQVVLTRRGDYYLPLKDRVLWGQKLKADLFISVHADKAVENASSGFSIYTLSEQASDAQAQLIAVNENKSDIVAGVGNAEDDDEVNRILVSLIQRVKVNDSVILSKSILEYVSSQSKLLPNPLRSAGFVVLKVPEIPSVLVELGFLSNMQDASDLQNIVKQQLVAKNIALGIEKYLWESKKLKQLPKDVKISGM